MLLKVGSLAAVGIACTTFVLSAPVLQNRALDGRDGGLKNASYRLVRRAPSPKGGLEKTSSIPSQSPRVDDWGRAPFAPASAVQDGWELPIEPQQATSGPSHQPGSMSQTAPPRREPLPTQLHLFQAYKKTVLAHTDAVQDNWGSTGISHQQAATAHTDVDAQGKTQASAPASAAWDDWGSPPKTGWKPPPSGGWQSTGTSHQQPATAHTDVDAQHRNQPQGKTQASAPPFKVSWGDKPLSGRGSAGKSHQQAATVHRDVDAPTRNRPPSVVREDFRKLSIGPQKATSGAARTGLDAQRTVSGRGSTSQAPPTVANPAVPPREAFRSSQQAVNLRTGAESWQRNVATSWLQQAAAAHTNIDPQGQTRTSVHDPKLERQRATVGTSHQEVAAAHTDVDAQGKIQASTPATAAWDNWGSPPKTGWKAPPPGGW